MPLYPCITNPRQGNHFELTKYHGENMQNSAKVLSKDAERIRKEKGKGPIRHSYFIGLSKLNNPRRMPISCIPRRLFGVGRFEGVRLTMKRHTAAAAGDQEVFSNAQKAHGGACTKRYFKKVFR